MRLGINRASSDYKQFGSINESFGSEHKPCIFLSHRSLDKKFVERIGKYIEKAGIDIYLDEYDLKLQRADEEANDKATTQCIQEGLKKSTHVLCALSYSTYTSWWVPYEIGYGDDLGKKIFSLKLKELPESKIPSFLRIKPCLKGIKELNQYLIDIIRENNMEIKKFDFYNNVEYASQHEASILQESYESHPLSEYLDQ